MIKRLAEKIINRRLKGFIEKHHDPPGPFRVSRSKPENFTVSFHPFVAAWGIRYTLKKARADLPFHYDGGGTCGNL
jgi:hypothetical protein